VGLTLFKRPAPRKEGADSDFAATVASLPPGAEAAVPLPAAADGVSPDSLPPDSQPFDSLPPDSLPPADLVAHSRPFDSVPPDSLPPEIKPPAGPFDPHPAQELPPFLGGPVPKPAAEATADQAGDDSALPMADQPTIAQVGRYALKRHLGLGGLGQVHEAWDPLLSRTVAIKTLQFESDPRTRSSLDRLFLNEARAVAGLSHPHIVTVYDAGLSPQGVYLAMERLLGKDLRQRLSEGWRPGPAVAAQLIRRVADALAYAHARGVVHCDIKPGNIFITGSDKPKVLDFGIARVAHGRTVPAALQGAVAGSPHYLAPEQLLGKDVDARTDVYSLGVVFYELLSGRRAFAGDSVEQITTAVLTNHPAPAHLIRSGVPESLSAIAARAMARDPEARYASASEMAADIRNWFDQPRSNAAARDERAEGRRGAKAGPATPRRWPWALAGASAALVAMLGVALVLVTRPGSRPTSVAVTSPDATSAAPAPTAPGTPGVNAPAAAREGDLMMNGGVPVAPGTAAGTTTGTRATAAAAGPTGTTSAGAAIAGAAAAQTPATAAAAPGLESAAAATAPGAAAPAEARPPPAAQRQAAAAPRAGGNVNTAAAAPASPTPNARDALLRRLAPANGASAQSGAASAASGAVQFAISPWGQIEVDGQPAGTAPPLTQISLPVGNHVITVRNADFPPITVTVQVQADKPAQVRHRFGQ
jgi:serine/threonine-protein kinase